MQAKRVEIDKSHPDYDRLMEKQKAREALMSPPGALKLPKLLEERRWVYGIPDEAFAAWPIGERVIVYQLIDAHLQEGRVGKDSAILMPAEVMARARGASPRGIIVSAGLQALDIMKTNGWDVGHIVWFGRHYTWQREIAITAGETDYVIPMNIGDLQGSEDLEQLRRSRDVRLVWDAESQEHRLVDPEGNKWVPKAAWRGED